MIESITLLGSASGRNAGDAALIDTIMESCDKACGTKLLYEIPTTKPDFIYRTYKNRVRAVSVAPWTLSLRLTGYPAFSSVTRTDLSLIFDATLFDRSLYNPFFNFLSSYSLLLPAAKRAGRKLGFFNVTAGPVTTASGRRMLKDLSELMDFITVRDQGSYRLLRELGVQNPNIMVTSDAAVNTPSCSEERTKEIFSKFLLDPNEETLAVNVNAYRDTWAGLKREPLSKEAFIAAYAEAVTDSLQELGANVLFVSTQLSDEPLMKELQARVRPVKRSAFLSNRDYDHTEIKGVLAKVSLLVAMRLHCMILGSSATTPIVALNYLPKVREYVESAGLGEYCINFEDFSAAQLASSIKSGWENRSKTRAHLSKQIPLLQSRAYKAAEIVAGIRRNEDPAALIQRLSAAV